MRDDGDLKQNISCGGSKWSDEWYILQIELAGYLLGVEYEERGAKDSLVLGLNNWVSEWIFHNWEYPWKGSFIEGRENWWNQYLFSVC